MQDKLARKAKFGGGGAASEPLPSTEASKVTVVATPKPQHSYSEVTLQIRMPSGEPLTQTFGAKEPLSAVRLYVDMKLKDTERPFNMMTSYPKKIFASEDFEKPLESLGKVSNIKDFCFS